MGEKTEKTIFDFQDYREYLRCAFDRLKAEKPYFSYRYFSKKAGISASNYLLLVIQGKRNLTRDSVFKFSKALDHTQQEHEFFENLVFLNQSQSLQEKNYYYAKVSGHQKVHSVRHLERLEYEYYANWYIPAIREMVGLEGFCDDPHWIAKQLKPSIKPSEAKKALKVLCELGFLVACDGVLKKREASITTGKEVRSIAIKNYHHTMIGLGQESLERYPSELRDVSSLTLALTEGQFDLLKEKLASFRREMLDLVAANEEVKSVYQINFQFFPLVPEALPGEKEKA